MSVTRLEESCASPLLGDIFRRNKARISVSYLLLVLENMLFALMPFVLGRAVDSLVASEYGAYYFFVSFTLFGLAAGFVRRRFDNRVYLRIWCGRAIDTVTRLMRRGQNPTKIISRTYMIKAFAEFLEGTVPGVIHCVIEITVALVMLWSFVPHVAMWVTCFCAGSLAASYLFAHALMRVEAVSQGQREEINANIMEGDPAGVDKGYQVQRGNYVRLADLDAYCWALNDVLSVAAIVSVLVSTTSQGYSAGVIMYNLAYTHKLFEKSGNVAAFFRHWKQLKLYGEFLQ